MWLHQLFLSQCITANEFTKYRCQKSVSQGLDIKNAAPMCSYGNGLFEISHVSIQVVPIDAQATLSTEHHHFDGERLISSTSDNQNTKIDLKVSAKSLDRFVRRLENVRFSVEFITKSHDHKIEYHGYTDEHGYRILEKGDHDDSSVKTNNATVHDQSQQSIFSQGTQCDRELLPDTTMKTETAFDWEISFTRSLSRPDLKGPWEARITFYELCSAIDGDILDMLEIQRDIPKLMTKKNTLGRVVIPFSVE